MAKKECYRYTEDGVLLVRKQEQGKAGAFWLLPEYRELWFQCSEKNPNRQYLQMVLGGWFGLHKFLEGNWLQGLGYLLTCGCFGVFYLYDLFSMVCGNFCFKKVSYVDRDGEKYAIVGSDTQALSYAASDMCYNLSGNLGREYEIALQNYLLMQEELAERLKPEPGQMVWSGM